MKFLRVLPLLALVVLGSALFAQKAHAQRQFQTCAFSDPRHCLGIGPGTLGQAYMSNGSDAYPAFSSVLPGVTSVNGTTIPANGTLYSFPALVSGYVLANDGTALEWIPNGSASFPSCTADQLYYAATSGTTATCLTLGTNLSITAGVLNASGGGSSTTFEVNGSGLASSSTVNFENSSATNGLTLTFANPSLGNVQLGLSGTLNNSGLTNSSVTFNGQSVALGATGNVNAGAAQYSIALNGASGATIGGITLPGSTGIYCIDYASLTSDPSLTGCPGSGTVNSGTSGQVAYYPATGAAVSGETTITAAQSAAISGDVTKAAGSASATVTGINGAVVPLSAQVLGSNASRQLTAATIGSTTQVIYNQAGTLTGNSNLTWNQSSNVFNVGASNTPGTFSVGALDSMTVNGVSIPIPGFALNSNIQGVIENHSYVNGTAAGAARIYLARSEGTISAPTIVANGDSLGTIYGIGYGGVTGNYLTGGYMRFSVDGTPSSTAMPTDWTLALAPAGSTAAATVIKAYQDAGVTIGSPTGGDKGAGTLNATGLYVNGTAVGGSPAFSTITSGTNTAAAMVVGSGASLAASGTGTIAATSLTALTGLPSQANNTILGNVSGASASPSALTALQALAVLSSTAPVSETTSYAPTGRTNAFGEYDMNCSAACTFTLNSGLFSTNDTLTIAQTGTGLASIALGAGVTLTGPGNLGYATLGGQGGYIQIQDTGSDAWRVISYQPADTKFTITGGTCATAASTTGGNMGGTITSAATGTVASCTYIITPGGSITAKTEWVGTMADQTQLGVPAWIQSAQGTSTITFTVPAATAASDVLSFAIHAE